MAERRQILTPAWLAGMTVLALAVAIGVWAMAGRDEPPAPTTTTTTTARADPVALLAAALAQRLASEAGVEPEPGQLECLASEALLVLDDDWLAELHDAPAVDADTLPEAERSALVRAVVECLGPDSAANLLGEGTTTTTSPVQLPDEGE